MKLTAGVEIEAFAVVPDDAPEGEVKLALCCPTRLAAETLAEHFEHHRQRPAKVVPVTLTVRVRAP